MRETISQELLRLWLQRARFIMFLEENVKYIKPQSYFKGEHCELCKSTIDLMVQPIQTLENLASTYRQQRDYTPIFNVRIWEHFFKTHTPCCTVCSKCQKYYSSRNKDFPIDERRFMRLDMSNLNRKDALVMLQENAAVAVIEDRKPLTTIDPFTQRVLKLW
jgi:hypothetical protein